MARERKRSVFTARDPDFAAKLEMMPEEPSVSTPPVPPPASTAKQTAPAAQVAAPAPVDVQQRTSEQTGTSANIEGHTSHRREPGRNPARPPIKSADDGMLVRLFFSWPPEVIDRARPMADEARCPVRKLLLRVWTEAKPELVDRLEKGISFREVPMDRRAAAMAERFGTQIKISARAYARLQQEIDPHGITGVDAPLSRWAREEMLRRADAYLSKAGY